MKMRICVKKRSRMLWIGIAVLTVGLNVLAWNSTAFCDAYIAYVFPVWVNTYGRVTGIFPFSVGEWMIGAGAAFLVFTAVLSAVLGIMTIASCIRKKWKQGALLTGIRKFAKGFYRFFAWTVLIVCLVMTLNCFILYHASAFSQKYFGEDTKEHSLEEVFALYNDIAKQCNELAGQVLRDGEGNIMYPAGKNLPDMEEKAVEIMKQLGKSYPQLDGYYPRPKALLASDFMCQQYMQGYYFPFSMEANYNDVMYILNKPATMCHELAHLRGYIFEDEANFISYLACVQSDDVTFRYSGYMSVLPYVTNDLYQAMQTSPDRYVEAARKTGIVKLDEQVLADDIFVTEEEWGRINGKALIDTETVDEISDAFVDTTLKINGVSDGMVSYSRVVELLLQYYAM